MSNGTRSNVYNRGIGYILFTAGVVLSVTLGSAVWRGFLTEQWQQANGIVYRSTMIQSTRLGEQSLYQPDIEYRYQYRGNNYTGHNLYLTDTPFHIEQPLSEQLSEFPVGSVQLVYINPDNPDEAVLVRGVQTQLLMGLLFAITCFGFGLANFRRRT